MANDEVELARNLLELWRAKESELEHEANDFLLRHMSKRQELDNLRAGIASLTKIEGLEPVGEDNVTHSVEVQDSVRLTDQVKITTKRIPTPKIVAEIVEAAGRPMSRDEIRAEFEQRGLAANYTNPANVVGTAVMRAKKRGWIEEVDGLFQTPTPDGVGTPTLEQVVR
jgi:hypothetical protein